MGDAFFRWDGFSYYAPFSAFLPSIALVSILWSFVVVITTTLVWITFKLTELIFSRAGWKIRIEHFLMCSVMFGLLGAIVWIGKRYLLPDFHSLLFRITVFICLLLVSATIAWRLHGKTEQWTDIIQERITPLVWLFGIIVICSVPVVAYHTWLKGPDTKTYKKTTQESATNKNRPNFILVTFDALTARNMPLYGYHRETTPFMSQLAKSATVFNWTEAESNYTVPTVTSLMTGKRVWSHYSYFSEGFSTEENKDNFPQILKNSGYHNRVYMGNRVTTPKKLAMESAFDFVQRLRAFQLVSYSIIGFIDEILYRFFIDKIPLYNWIIKEDFLLYKILWVTSPEYTKVFVPPERAFNDFIKSMDMGEIPEPYFVWFHFYPPHDAYLPPTPFMGMFNSSSRLRSEKTQQEAIRYLKREYFKNSKETQSMVTDRNILRDRYDESIRYCDKQFEDFIRRLDAKNISANAIIILSSDHGESFDHGYIIHGGIELYEQVTHIPLIIKEQNQSRGFIVKDMVEQIDIPATILDLAGVPVPQWMEGRSLVPLMRGKKLLPRPAFSMRLDSNRPREKLTKGTIVVWEGDYKLIYYLDDDRSLLFNLREDSDELYNLIQKKPEIGKRMLALIKDNLEKANDRIASEL